jgi:hypothetical protein
MKGQKTLNSWNNDQQSLSELGPDVVMSPDCALVWSRTFVFCPAPGAGLAKGRAQLQWEAVCLLASGSVCCPGALSLSPR